MFHDMPISIVHFDGDTVTFTVSQKWKNDCSMSWIATSYPVNADGDIRCDKETSVIPDQKFTYTAACVGNEATVSVYVYDQSLKTADNPAIPAYCVSPDVVGNKVAYNFTLPCDCSTPPTSDVAPSPAPTSTCDFFDVAFDEKDIAKGAYVSLQWKGHGFRVSAQELKPGTGGYMPNGYVRLFDTAKPVDSTGFGTPDLAGNFGNVLVVQQTGGMKQWKANEAGGIITFEFASPMEEVLEIGLLNVVKEVRIHVTDVDNATRTFVVSPGGPRSQKNVVLDVSYVTKIEVSLPGPIAITHIGICGDITSSPSPSSSPSTAPSAAPSKSPTSGPTSGPTIKPSSAPSGSPSTDPSSLPSLSPSATPSVTPSIAPTSNPSKFPTANPTSSPSFVPTGSPSTDPSSIPSLVPSKTPSVSPSIAPSSTPSISPTASPTSGPTIEPSSTPSGYPSANPSRSPSSTPSARPSSSPSASPTTTPTSRPSTRPSSTPNALPSGEPSLVPSASPSTMCSMGPLETGSIGGTKYYEVPLSIVSSDGDTVTFTVNQKWKDDCSISWIATSYRVSDDGDIRCDKETAVIPDQAFKYTATCVDKTALVSVYVYDSSLNTTDNPAVPSYCSSTDVVGNKVAYNFTLPCGCGQSTDASPSPAPTSACEFYDVSFDEKNLAAGAYVSLQWKDRGFGITAEELKPGTGGYTPNGYVRLFDTSKPVNGTGFGTPDLAGDFGNVLIIQQAGGDATQWKANEGGGIIRFDFTTPIDEVLELGLLNVVKAVTVVVTDADGATRTFIVSPGGPQSLKNVAMDVSQVTKIEVSLPGPTAISHLGICKQLSDTVSPSAQPSSGPSSLPSGSPNTAPSASPSVVPSSAPSSSPIASPSASPSDMCTTGPREIGSFGGTKYSDIPVSIVSSDGDTVTFAVSQKWKDDCSISWIATSYPVNDGGIRCDKETAVIPDQDFTYTATCVDDEAFVSIYVYDTSLKTTDNPAVPSYCISPDVVGNKVAYNFTIPCHCNITAQQVSSPTASPADVCQPYDVTFDDRNLASGAYVSLQWKNHGFGISARELTNGTGGYMPNGYVRLFDTSKPVNSTGFGTPELAGDFGKVLVIQQAGGDAAQWKANQAGGIITFEFTSPMDEVLELGLLNVVKEVRIKVTDADEATRTFVVSPGGPRSHKNVVLDVSRAIKVEVFLPGPTAITHLGICRDSADTSAPSSIPTARPTARPTTSPTEAPSGSPSASPSRLPSNSPSAAPSRPLVCVPEAALVRKSVAKNGTGDYTSNPITILYQGRSTIRFQVDQKWVAGDIGWIAVNYAPADGSAPEVCRTTEALSNASSTPGYTAKCYNGVAKIDVFAYDCSFNVGSDVVIPSRCQAWSNDGKYSAFHFTVPCDPEPHLDGVSCDMPTCVPEAHLIEKSVRDGSYGDVLSNPVNIVHFGVDTVTFRVDQNWKDGDISWLSVAFNPVNVSDTVCKSTEGVSHVSSTSEYTAKCTHGVTVIDIYAYDCTFAELAGIVVPKGCLAWNGAAKTSHFRYSVPCDRADAGYCVDKPTCMPEARSNFKSVADGGTGNYNSIPVKILRQGGSTVEFQVEQTMKNGEIGWIAVDYAPADNSADTTCASTEAVAAGDSTPTYVATCVNGVAEIDVYAYDCTFIGVPNVDATVPESCQPIVDVGKKVHYHFILPCLCGGSPSAATSSVRAGANAVHASPVASPTWARVALATNKLECQRDIFEDYETHGQSESWEHGSEFHDSGFTTFLGRLGKNHATVSKIFEVPKNSDYIDISFDFYDIDGMPSADKIWLGVQGSYLDLALFQASGKMDYYNDIVVTKTMSSSGRISFNYDKTDTIYGVKVRIPKNWYMDHYYKLPISIKIDTNRDISEESYGVDNFRMTASCKRRDLKSDGDGSIMPPVSEPDESGDDGSFYCLSADFPCEGGAGMVHVCHYSTRKGYESFCIPEADSEILRFYSQDYCGPCVGGFGGVNMLQ